MAGRYSGWFPKSGDIANASPDQLLVARKLLGYLMERRRHGAPSTLLIRQATPGGGLVEAFLRDGQPAVRIVAPRKGGEKIHIVGLEGFIVSPPFDPNPAAPDEVVIQPVGKDKWQTWFYETPRKPIGYDGKFGTYKKAFPLPEGLRLNGNLDWRNKDESLSVTWLGPTSRYFNQQSNWGTKVYYKGAVLLDIDQLPIITAGDWPWFVRGACINGSTLVVAVSHDWLWRNSQFRTMKFIAVPLERHPELGLPGLPPALQPRLVADRDNARLLLERLDPAGTSDYSHLWAFNQSGTEARTLRFNQGVSVVESVVRLPEDFVEGVAEYSETANQWPATTYSSTETREVRRAEIVGTETHHYSSYVSPPYESEVLDVVSFRDYMVNYDWDKEYEFDHAVDTVISRTYRTPGRLKIAVDYRDDIPVYAYHHGRNSTYSFTRVADIHGDCFGENTNLQHGGTYWDTVANPPVERTRGLYHFDGSGYVDEGGTYTVSSSEEGYLRGVEVDWMPLVTRQVASTWADAGASTTDVTWDFTYHTEEGGVDIWHIFGFTTGVASAWNSWAWTRKYDTHQYSGETGLHDVIYLDLRSRWLAYTTRTNDQDTTTAFDQGWTKINPGPYGLYGHTTDPYAHKYGPPDTGEWVYANSQYVTSWHHTHTQTSLQRDIRDFVVTLDGTTLATTEVYRVESPYTASWPVTGVRTVRWGDPQRFCCGPGDRHVGRTPAEYVALSNATHTWEDTQGYETPALTQDFGHGTAHRLAFQTYQGRWAYSFMFEAPGVQQSYGHGLSHGTLPALTSYTASPPEFYPITILPKTATRVARQAA